MPFTPSHAVIALPFVRTRLVPGAVAVGAMTPDVPLFVRATPITYAGTHDLWWLPGTTVLALALLVVWRIVLRPTAAELSPRWLAERLPASWGKGAVAALRETFPPSFGRIVLLGVSLLLGVASHILWDAFTHEGRAGSSLLPGLAELWGPVPGYTWLQHGSSVLGLLILGVWALAWLRHRPAVPATRALSSWVRVAWPVSLAVILIAAWAVGLAALGPLTDDFTVAHLAYRVLPPACAVWAGVTLALCLVIQAWRSGPTRGGERDTPGRGA